MEPETQGAFRAHPTSKIRLGFQSLRQGSLSFLYKISHLYAGSNAPTTIVVASMPQTFGIHTEDLWRNLYKMQPGPRPRLPVDLGTMTCSS